MRRRRSLGYVYGLAFWTLAIGVTHAADDKDDAVLTARMAVEPAAPALPAGVVSALQEKRFDAAVADLAKWAAEGKPDEDRKAYAALITGIARRLEGKLDLARQALAAAIEAEPKGPWASKLRAELAAVEIAAKRFDAAEKLARAEAEGLLDDGRKDRLAGVYRSFAERLIRPESPITPPDPEGAHALLEQARTLAKGGTLRAELLLAMGRASQQAGNHGRAVAEFQAYVAEYGKTKKPGRELAEARFRLGEAQLASGQPLPARMTWTDLARDLKGDDAKPYRPLALYQIARTYGIPNPGDDAQLNLGVASLRRFL